MDLDRLAAGRGVEGWFVALNPSVLEVVTKSGLADRLGRQRLLFNARAAIRQYQARSEAARASPDTSPPPSHPN